MEVSGLQEFAFSSDDQHRHCVVNDALARQSSSSFVGDHLVFSLIVLYQLDDHLPS